MGGILASCELELPTFGHVPVTGVSIRRKYTKDLNDPCKAPDHHKICFSKANRLARRRALSSPDHQASVPIIPYQRQ